MKRYNPEKIEKKWQAVWEKEGLYNVKDSSRNGKQYVLIEFPYPSGDGLHVGHVRSYSALDAISRKKRMEGYNVLFPIGWDAFGLPTENYAIKKGIHPQEATKKNVANFKKQLKSLGLSFDWSREINTTDPGYYKWTQWIFLKLYEKGMAYQAEMPINWCPSCKTGLANEEVIEGNCERCGNATEKKVLKQWMIKITKYADRLIEDLAGVDFPERVKSQQINWIGRSSGVELKFKIQKSNLKNSNKNSKFISVFTTRVDTLFGVTAVILSPDHHLLQELTTEENKQKVNKYVSEYEKQNISAREDEKEKTGVFTGSYCLNPINNEEVPIWIGDYVVLSYGGGAVMMVPAHDFRDWDFAKKYEIDIKPVVITAGNIISPELGRAYKSKTELKNQKNYNSIISGISKSIIEQGATVDDGFLINSGDFDGLSSQDAREKIIKWLEKKGVGKKTINYKLRDWIFSRQHYWGEPIPIIHCPKCGTVPVLEKDLPVELPYVKKYQPTGTGESPLAAITEWVNTECPKCKGSAKRETDTMPNWAGSNWYFLRYLDPKNDKALADDKKIKYWMPVDWYNGGMEHTTLHLLYSRFIYKFLYDIGAVPQKEPYKKRTSHGIVLASDGRKMSKSFGNVINPDDIVSSYGADTLRLYEMFMGPFESAIAWNEDGVKGVKRFLDKVWNYSVEFTTARKENDQKWWEKREKEVEEGSDCQGKEIRVLLNKSIKKITEDMNSMKFNTAVSQLMILLNSFYKIEREEKIASNSYSVVAGGKIIPLADFEKFVMILSPFAPHIAEEIWSKLGHGTSIFLESWPKPKASMLKEEKVNLIVQVNGRVRDKVEVNAGMAEDEAKELVMSSEKVKNWILDKEIKKVIYVPNKIINIVV